MYKVNNSSAALNWNYVVPNSIASALNHYKIYRSKGNGSWVLIDSTQQKSYMDTVSACGDTIYYKIGINIVTSLGYSNQESFSNVRGDYFFDYYAPIMTIIDTIIFDLQTGDAYLYWFPNQSQDVALYVIYKNINPYFTPIDTLFGQNNLSYIDTTNSPSNIPNILDYAIAAADTCCNISPFYWYISIENNKSEFTVKAYPNPTEDNIFIEFQNIVESADYKLYNLSGQLLQSGFIRNTKTHKLDISHISAGFYFLVISNDIEVYTKKIVVN